MTLKQTLERDEGVNHEYVLEEYFRQEIAHGKALNMPGYLRNSKEAGMAGVVQARKKQ